jgi:hypothetical protein
MCWRARADRGVPGKYRYRTGAVELKAKESTVPTTKESIVPTTEVERITKNGKLAGGAEGVAEGIAGGIEGLTSIALHQAEESFKQGEKAELVLRDQSLASIKSAESLGLSLISTISDVTAPFTPNFPSIVPAGNLDTLVKIGFDITQQLLSSERRLAEAVVGLATRRAS